MYKWWNKLSDEKKGQIAYILCFVITELLIILSFIIVGIFKTR